MKKVPEWPIWLAWKASVVQVTGGSTGTDANADVKAANPVLYAITRHLDQEYF